MPRTGTACVEYCSTKKPLSIKLLSGVAAQKDRSEARSTREKLVLLSIHLSFACSKGRLQWLERERKGAGLGPAGNSRGAEQE